jgi:glucose/arabinose dehydrogenase/cytochrome c2
LWDGIRSLCARRPLLAVAVLGAVVAASFFGGYSAAQNAAGYHLRIGFVEPLVQRLRAWAGAPATVRWTIVQTHSGTVETASIAVTPAGEIYPMALEDLGGHLVVMNKAGEFSYFTPSGELRSFDADLPLNWEALREVYPDRTYATEFFRGHDLLAVRASPQHYDLYASYDRFTGTCFEVVVARMRIAAGEQGLEPLSPWEDVFTAEPCWPNESARRFYGLQVGGRMALRDPDTLLIALGDAGLDGAPGVPDAPQNPEWDLGKVVAISLSTGRSERFATGFRNPQGLMVDAQGRIWLSEHGPRGGDELNLVRRGVNYGWPRVTYGLPYTVPVPPNIGFGGHDGYQPPVLAFSPAIGPSQLLDPSVEEFPFWETSLLLASLRNESIYVLRMDGDDVVYVEPFFIDRRLRDIISRPNGEIAMVSEEFGGGGHLILMRRHVEGRGEESFEVVDRRSRSAIESSSSQTRGVDAGERIFQRACSSCHSMTGEAGAGPALNGVVGRDIASGEGFAYSAPLLRARGAWTRQRLRSYLTNPESEFAGTTMPDPGLSGSQADDVIAYLRTTQ